MTIKHASLGSVSHGTLRDEDLLAAFISELEWQISRNGEYFSRPENFAERDCLASLIGESQDCFSDDGETIREDCQELASELINETFPNVFQLFCAPFCYFGAHYGDGSDFGFWPLDIEEIKEQVEFVSSTDQEYPDDDFRGEWLHVNERGNCTVYVRSERGDADGNCKVQDREVWSIV